MDCVNHFTLGCYDLRCGFFLFGDCDLVSKFVGLLLLLIFSLKVLYSGGFFTGLIRCLCCLRGRNGLRSTMIMDDSSVGLKKFQNVEPLIDEIEREMHASNPSSDSVDGLIRAYNDGIFDREEGGNEKLNANSDQGFDANNEGSDSDVTKLRKLIKIERQRANAALGELAKERASSATAAEEAMAMILRLQNEKSQIELEAIRYRRLAEEKQIHDQQVINSLQWLVWRHESERSLLADQLNLCTQKLYTNKRDWPEDAEATHSSFNGSIWNTLENVLYSSRDANLSPE